MIFVLSLFLGLALIVFAALIDSRHEQAAILCMSAGVTILVGLLLWGALA